MLDVYSCLLIFSYICGSVSKICWHPNSIATKPWNCCDNHEEIAGVCVECRIGYISDSGEKCKECPTGYYGRKCTDACRCNGTKSCHHIDGCINEGSTTVVVEKESTTSLDKVHRVTSGESLSFTSINISTGESVSELTTTNDKSPPITYATSTAFSSVTSQDVYTGLSQRDILVYSVGTGGITCLVLLLLCLGRYILNIHRHRSVLQESETPKHNVAMRVLSVGYTEGIYETIDESKMKDAHLQVIVPVTIETTSTDESTDSGHSDICTNEYLNPYQPIVPDPEKHEYAYVTDISSEDSVSSGSSVTNSAYLNPYQQIIPDSELHNYLSMQAELNSLGSSTSDKNKHDDEFRMEKKLEEIEYKEHKQNVEEIEHEHKCAADIYFDDYGSSKSCVTNSAHQNPYQQIITDSEPHNYLSIQAEIHCMGSSVTEEDENDDEYRKEETLEEQTLNVETLELRSPDSHICLNEKMFNSELEIKIECTSNNNETPGDNIKDNLPVEVSVDDVSYTDAFSTLEKCEPKKLKPQ